ncbi:MAG: carboxypeptidase M32 [Anaerolineae bacterium]|nr:carboxypeptidase M32 [Anaerolineae bacterium]
MGKNVEKLKAYLGRPNDLLYAAAVLNWDQEVYMPLEGVEARSEQLATLNSLAHQMLTSDELKGLLEAAEEEVKDTAYDSDEASLVRITRRGFDQRTKIPTEFVEEESRVSTQAFVAWREARKNKSYAGYQPHLEKVIDLNIRRADYLGYEEHPYDALLDLFEPGMKTTQVEALFSDLKTGLKPLVREIADKDSIDDTFFSKDAYNTERQWDFTMLLLRDIGYDFNRGRQDKAPHPFTINFSTKDVRVTTRLLPHRPQSAVFSTIHEGGHALYELGIPEKFERTPLAQGASLGMHESQSRLWENQVARSKAFWKYYYPIFRAFYPEQLADIDLDHFYRAINKVQPDFIRVEADEVTYNMHIFVRFELEKDLLTGVLAVKDVPEAWNTKYQEYLGIIPPDDGVGCLQDVHWSHGTLGYFPTYTIGNIISAQLYAQARQDIPDVEDLFAQGEFAPLLTWLRKRVHSHGAKFTSAELVERELGQKIQAQPLLDYMREKYTEIYDL